MITMKLWRLAFAMLAAFSFTSCATMRGYLVDGKDGPDIYSYKHHSHDTNANGLHTFQFPIAKEKAVWLNTLHFYNQGKYFKDVTLSEVLLASSSNTYLQRARWPTYSNR